MKTTSTTPTNRLRLAHDFKLKLHDMEHPRGATLTIFNEAYTIRQVIEKFSQGLDLGQHREGVFTENATHDDYDYNQLLSLDLAERDEIINQERQKQIQLNERLVEIRAEQKTRLENTGRKDDDLSPRPEEDAQPEIKKPVKKSAQKNVSETD